MEKANLFLTLLAWKVINFPDRFLLLLLFLLLKEFFFSAALWLSFAFFLTCHMKMCHKSRNTVFFLTNNNNVKTITKTYLKDEHSFTGFEITMKNHCGGDIFEHSFRR